MPEGSYCLLKDLRILRKKVKFMFYKAKLTEVIKVIEEHIEKVEKIKE